MSIEDLPEEILSKIAKHTAAAHYFEDELYGRLPVRPHRVLIGCEDIGVAALASVNSRMRRICLPVLFARVHVQPPDIYGHLDALRKFYKLVRRRSHIAFHITSLDPTVWGSSRTSKDEKSDMLAEIIRLLPRLSRVEGDDKMAISVTVRLLEAIKEHEQLLSIPGEIPLANVNDYMRLADRTDFSKIRHKYSAFIHNSEMLALQLAVGINVEIATIRFDPADSEIFSGLRWTQLRSVEFIEARKEEHARELGSWLPTFVSKTAPNVSEITISDAGVVLPFLAGLASASAGGRESHSKLAYIGSFTIKRCSRQAPSPQRCGDAPSSIEDYDWTKDWLISSIRLFCEDSLAYHNFSAFFPWLSRLACMAEEIEIIPPNSTKPGTIEQLMFGIEIFKNLTRLSFRCWLKNMLPRSTSRDLETEADILSVIGEFSVSLKRKCPRLYMVSYNAYGFKSSSFHRKFIVHLRDQLLQDGGGIAYDIQSLRD